MREWFHKIAVKVSGVMGMPVTFVAAALLIVGWGLTGPIFDFSNTWQLVINTGTTIITFLMVILLQNTQNRDSKAMQLKLDELIHASRSARDSFIALENLPDEAIDKLDTDFKQIGADHASHTLHDLHRKVQAEKARRKSFVSSVSDALHLPKH